MPKYRPTWVEVNLDNVAHNVRQIKQRIGDKVCLMATVKGDGYGHGAVEVARTALRNGAEKLAVAMVDEGIELREAGIEAPILILGMSTPDNAPEIVRYDLMQAVCTPELPAALAEEAVRQGKRAVVNIKINSGMNRIGVRPAQAVAYVRSLQGLPNLDIEGIFTHFATSYYEKEYCHMQFSRFMEAVNSLDQAGIHIPYRHCCNSGGVLNFPHMYLNQVRPGSILTNNIAAQTPEANLGLRSAFELKSIVAFINNIDAGESLGYNLMYTADSPRRIAVVPIGWGDGFPADLINKGYMLIHGRRCPLRGRICMDQTMVDITDVPEEVKIGDEVVIIGRQGQEEIPATEWTALTDGKISYITLRMLITRRVPRLYIQETKPMALRSHLRPDLTGAIAQ